MKVTRIETISLAEFPNVIWIQVHTDSGHVGLAHGAEREGSALDAQTERGEDVDQFHVPQSTR
jgi:hypothetical protein